MPFDETEAVALRDSDDEQIQFLVGGVGVMMTI